MLCSTWGDDQVFPVTSWVHPVVGAFFHAALSDDSVHDPSVKLDMRMMVYILIFIQYL